MATRGRPRAELELSDEERATLQRWSRRAKSAQALALRCRIVLACAEGLSNVEVAGRLSVSRMTVGKWRARFLQQRLDGLLDEDRPGRPPSVTMEQVEDVIVATLEQTPRKRHPLVACVDGAAQRAVEVHDRADLARLRTQTTPR